MATIMKEKPLFGGNKHWRNPDWTELDDRVRGGRSESHLLTDGHRAEFCGILDIHALRGAGFASQRTTGDDRSWDLEGFTGVKLRILNSDVKNYTFSVKDMILRRQPEGQGQGTLSYEADFTLSGSETDVFLPFSRMNATYRGKPINNAPELRLSSIKQMSIMMRSFFGEQEGRFSLTIGSISAYTSEGDILEAEKGKNVPDLNEWETYVQREAHRRRILHACLMAIACGTLITVTMSSTGTISSLLEWVRSHE
ncbi:CIA30-domain-containing protein [Eremomyces bilateralis CBS 781.70]|uniref:CIA30-domain-containing protein n=1 Tax=Eremomyces bilateralis CBS 781.70 TaxID=1392243 RepID=A0A6G1GGX8_9PEZI|nr:CIA30-domain-containing protein [Eremomyces bilateralis CBS 781.70]KAF1817264.1 CIA30-domain-containing protein [Eremomyces bilateralis CBS 781.70]